MQRYSVSEVIRPEYAIDDSTNVVALRADLHLEFDAGGFVLAQKSEKGYTVHCLRASPDILPAFHNCQTRPLSAAIKPELIYARLAYSIFPR
jgi:hypothetical protein